MSAPPPAAEPTGSAPGAERQVGRLWVGAAVAAAGVLVLTWLVVRDGDSAPEKGIAGVSGAVSGSGSVSASGAATPPPGAGAPSADVSPGALPAAVRSRARDHAPGGCDLVVRLDMARVLALPAAQNHFGPVLREIAEGGETDTPASRRTRDLLRNAGIDPRRDIAEVLICAANLEGPAKTQKLAVVLTGNLRPETVVAAASGAEGSEALPAHGGRKVLALPSKGGDRLTLGQAADGALVISNDRGFFDAAVATSRTAEDAYRLPAEPDMAAVVVPEYFARGGDNDGPLSRHRADVRRVTITVFLAPGAGSRAEVRASMRDAASAADLSSTAGALLESAQREGGGLAGQLLTAAKMRVDGSDLVVDAPWSAAIVDRVAKNAAGSLRDTFQRGALRL
ncbi:MAG: hypothetical protein WKG00_05480 [Polyangiaceae bacterium]